MVCSITSIRCRANRHSSATSRCTGSTRAAAASRVILSARCHTPTGGNDKAASRAGLVRGSGSGWPSHRARSFGRGQVGSEPAAAVPHRLAGGGGVPGESDRVPGHLAGVAGGLAQLYLHPGPGEPVEQVSLTGRGGSSRPHLPAKLPASAGGHQYSLLGSVMTAGG